MDDRALRAWVSDQLHALVGFAEGSLAAYVVNLGELRSSAARALAASSSAFVCVV